MKKNYFSLILFFTLLTFNPSIVFALNPEVTPSEEKTEAHSSSAKSQFQAYDLDPAHTAITFKIKHLVISTTNGRFDKASGSFSFNESTGEISKVAIKIDATTIDTNEPDRDKHLKGKDFFDVEKFPTIEFVGDSVTIKDKKPVEIIGDMTIHGVKKKVSFQLEYKGTAKDPWGNSRLGFEASTKINRKDFGLVWNKALDAGGVMIADEVAISVEGEAIASVPKK